MLKYSVEVDVKDNSTKIINNRRKNPLKVTAIEVTDEKLDNGEIPGVFTDCGFPYIDIPVEKRGVDEFGVARTATIIGHFFLEPGDFIVTELTEDDHPRQFVLDGTSFDYNFEPIEGEPGHYQARTECATHLAHSAHPLGDLNFAFKE